jgi:hypothetical protein
MTDENRGEYLSNLRRSNAAGLHNHTPSRSELRRWAISAGSEDGMEDCIRLTVDPAELRSGDVVIELSDHDVTGCHCDVLVTIERPLTPEEQDEAGYRSRPHHEPDGFADNE